jgi:hypothetical protein
VEASPRLTLPWIGPIRWMPTIFQIGSDHSSDGRMSEISSTIASAVEEQGAATKDISRNVQRAAETI